MRSGIDLLGVDVDVSRSKSAIADPSYAPIPDLNRPRRSIRRRRRPDYIRDVRRLIEASWLAKVGQRWRWTPVDREYLYQLALRRPAWEIMALWDCYLERPWHECHVTHFCEPGVIDWLLDNPRFKSLAAMYMDRLISKSRRLTREML